LYTLKLLISAYPGTESKRATVCNLQKDEAIEDLYAAGRGTLNNKREYCVKHTPSPMLFCKLILLLQ
jgi:hypothetical protein